MNNTTNTDTIPAGTPALTSANAAILDGAVKRLRRNFGRHVRWHAACRDHLRNGGPVPNPRTMPSKTAKHHGYDDARRIARLLNVKVPAELASTLHEWRFVLTAAGVEDLPVPAVPTR